LAIGNSNIRYALEMARAMEHVFGVWPRGYESPTRIGELKIVNRVAALAWRCVFGFADCTSITKRIPDIAFNVSEELRSEFLRGYLLGDGTVSGGGIAFGTS